MSVGTVSPWRYKALDCIRELSARGKPFTSDDVHYEIGDPTGDPNQMGAAFRDAKAMGIITNVGVQKSKRKESKGRLIQVWTGANGPQGGLF